MKISHPILFVVCSTLAGCDRRNEATNSAADTAASLVKDSDEQVQRQKAQLDVYDKQSKHAEEQLQVRADMQKRADDGLRAQGDMHKRADAVPVAQEQVAEAATG